MRIRLVFLGGARDAAGRAGEGLELHEGATVGEAAQVVAARYPALAPLLPTCRWARNFEFAEPGEGLADGDELAVVPPVAGGAPSARVTSEPLDVDAVVRTVAGPDVGATVVFVGTVREQARGRRVERLEYEAYMPMAERQLERIAEGCSQDHPGTRVAIAHRVGALAVGETSVVIAAASPHRAHAFAACRQAIERIKIDVPIFKREVGADGAEWVGWGGG